MRGKTYTQERWIAQTEGKLARCVVAARETMEVMNARAPSVMRTLIPVRAGQEEEELSYTRADSRMRLLKEGKVLEW